MINYHKNFGSVLVIVMLFCILISSVVVGLFQKSILLQKMHQNHLSETLNRLQLEDRVVQTEDILFQDFSALKNNAVRHIQFVPDTLAFGENHGLNYYLIEKSITEHNNVVKLQSVVAIRDA